MHRSYENNKIFRTSCCLSISRARKQLRYNSCSSGFQMQVLPGNCPSCKDAKHHE